MLAPVLKTWAFFWQVWLVTTGSIIYGMISSPSADAHLVWSIMLLVSCCISVRVFGSKVQEDSHRSLLEHREQMARYARLSNSLASRTKEVVKIS